MFAKGEEENLQIKIGIVATYSRAESKSTYFSPIFLMKISFSKRKHQRMLCMILHGDGLEEGTTSMGRAWAMLESNCSIFSSQVWQ